MSSVSLEDFLTWVAYGSTLEESGATPEKMGIVIPDDFGEKLDLFITRNYPELTRKTNQDFIDALAPRFVELTQRIFAELAQITLPEPEEPSTCE